MVAAVFIIGLTILLTKKAHFYRYVRNFNLVPILTIGYFSFNVMYRFHDYNYIQTCSVSQFSVVDHENLLYFLFSLYQYLGSCTNSPFIHTLVGDVLGAILIVQIINFFDSITSLNILSLKKIIVNGGYGLVKLIPFIKSKIDAEMLKNEHQLEEDLKSKSRAISESYHALPENGIPSSQILQLMSSATTKEDVIWENGRISGAVYYGKHGHIKLLNEAFSMYSISNPLHSDIWLT